MFVKMDERIQSGERPVVISIEGNIGSGKTTVINYLKQFDNVQAHAEPVEKWQDVSGVNLLTKLYEDPKRWAFQFHSYVTVTGLEILNSKMPAGKNTRILERSMHSNRYCFTELSRKLGNLTVDEHAVLDGFWEALNATNRDVVDLDLIVYLKTSPEVAFQRMQRRGRQEESTVPFSYLQALHTCYEEWLIEKKFGEERLPPVLVLDANPEIDEMGAQYKKHENVLRGLEPYTAAKNSILS